jgi:hypothetical protein
MSATIPDALAVLTPGAEWALTGDTYAGLEWLDKTITKPSEAAIDVERAALDVQAPFDACKKQASDLLYETDWTTISDVADPTKSNPYLMNVAAFVTYRNAVRQYAVNPVVSPVWPVRPTAVWG